MNVPRKYVVLRAIAFLLKLLAWLVLLVGIAGAVALLALGNPFSTEVPEALRALTTAGIFAVPLLAIVWFVQLFAFGSILSLLIGVEENTRSLAARPPA